jgi:hypothetical protein
LFKKVLKNIFKENTGISSFSELSVQLLNLHGLLGSVFSESYYKKYNSLKNNQQILKKAEKDISHRLGSFWQQSTLYKNQLQDYIRYRVYEKEKKHNRILLLYTDTHKKSVKSICNLIKFLTYENEQQAFNNLQNAIRQLIIDTDLYIENVWIIIQEIMANQIEINNRSGINTQEKYILYPLNEDNIKPNDPNPAYLNLNQLIQNLL